MKNPRSTVEHPHKNWKDNVSDVKKILTQIAERDYSQNTKRAIRTDIALFLGWYKGKNEESLVFKRVVPRDIIDYRGDLQKAGRKPSSINRKLISLRLFFAMAMDAGLIVKNPCTGIKQAAMQRLAPKGLTAPDTRKLLREVEIRGKKRDMVIVELMLGAGLRISEVVNLKMDDVELSERKGHVVIRSSKGNKTRLVPLSHGLRMMIAEHLEGRTDTDHIFIGQRGALKTIAISKMIEKYGRKAEVKLSPHTLRHTFAFNYLKSNPSDIVGLAQILGHANINTTAIYTQNRLEDLQEKMERVTY